MFLFTAHRQAIRRGHLPQGPDLSDAIRAYLATPQRDSHRFQEIAGEQNRRSPPRWRHPRCNRQLGPRGQLDHDDRGRITAAGDRRAEAGGDDQGDSSDAGDRESLPEHDQSD